MWVHSKPKADKNNKNCKAPNFKAWGIAFFLTFDLFQPTREVQKCWVSCALLVIRKYQAAIIMHALSHKTEKKQKKNTHAACTSYHPIHYSDNKQARHLICFTRIYIISYAQLTWVVPQAQVISNTYNLDTYNWRSASFERRNLVAPSTFFLNRSSCSPSSLGVNNLIYFFTYATNCFLSKGGCSYKYGIIYVIL